MPVGSHLYCLDCWRAAASSRRSKSPPTPISPPATTSRPPARPPRERKLLATAPYAQATIPEPYRRHIVNYHRKEAAGTIVVDSDARYLYYVLPEGKATRYGVTAGEDGLSP